MKLKLGETHVHTYSRLPVHTLAYICISSAARRTRLKKWWLVWQNWIVWHGTLNSVGCLCRSHKQCAKNAKCKVHKSHTANLIIVAGVPECNHTYFKASNGITVTRRDKSSDCIDVHIFFIRVAWHSVEPVQFMEINWFFSLPGVVVDVCCDCTALSLWKKDFCVLALILRFQFISLFMHTYK